MNTQKISDKDTIRFVMEEEGIMISIKYNKRSTIKTRLEQLDKFREVLRKI